MNARFLNNRFQFFCFVLLFLLLYSCKTEYDKHDRTSEKRYGKEIEDARQWVKQKQIVINKTNKYENFSNCNFNGYLFH